MLVIFLCDAAIAGLLVLGWYLVWRQVNRRRAAGVVSRIVEVVAGCAVPSPPKWLSASRFQVDLRFLTAIGESSFTVELLPREMPVSWLLALLHKRKEMITFRAALERRPSNHLILSKYNCWGCTRRKMFVPDECYSLGSIVVTTREDWRTATTILEGILAARPYEFSEAEFRRQAPHLVVTAPLTALNPEADEQGLFALLQELASCAAASSLPNREQHQQGTE